MVDQLNVTDTEETVFEKVQINDAVHGTFNIEVPQGMSDSDILNELDNLDLDLLLGIGNIDKDIGETNVEKIKEFENSSGAGLRDGKWYGHDSLEGGTKTIAYGHKLTAEEVKQGFIEINGEQVDYRKGLTQDQAEALLNKDAKWAETHAVASLKKVGLDGDEGKVEALTSLIYNVGSGAWGKSKAKQYLEAGQIEDFMHEAFSEEVGFVKVNGEKLRGLVRRRAAEAQLFASANIDEGGGFATMMQDVLAAINPISSAAAAEVTPQTPLDSKPTTEITQLPTLKRNAKDTESVGTLQDMLGMDVGEDRGIFGPATEKAVKAFQKEQGLTADGIVGKNTWAALQGAKPQESSILSKLNPIGSAQAGEAKAAIPPPRKPDAPPLTNDEQGLWDVLTSTPAIAGIKDVIQQYLPQGQLIWKEDMLSPQGFEFLKNHAATSIAKGKLILDYKTDKEGVKSVGHKAGIPDLRKPSNEMKFFLGKGAYVRVNNVVYLADEYDYNFQLALRDQSIFSKLAQIYERYEEYEKGNIGGFAVIDSILERFQSKPGEGPSVRIKLGTIDELKLSKADFNKLPTLEEYERNQTIRPENKGWKPNS